MGKFEKGHVPWNKGKLGVGTTMPKGMKKELWNKGKLGVGTTMPKGINKEPIDWKIIIAAIAGLTIIEAIALLKGINGTLLIIMMSAISGLAGLSLPQLKKRSN